MAKDVPARKLTANDASVQGVLGQVREIEGKRYRYAQVKDAAVAANDVVEYSTTDSAVTPDRSGGTSIGRTVAGVAVGTISSGQYGYVQVGGKATLKVPAGIAIAAGDLLVPAASTDGGVIAQGDASTTNNGQVFAVALGADTATTTGAGTVSAQLIRV